MRAPEPRLFRLCFARAGLEALRVAMERLVGGSERQQGAVARRTGAESH